MLVKCMAYCHEDGGRNGVKELHWKNQPICTMHQWAALTEWIRIVRIFPSVVRGGDGGNTCSGVS